jgi:pSer/pThr/pTyr-binding forkhead associated (FHA) protein
MDVNLIMFKENGQRKDFPMRGNTFVIGRREDCDLRIPLPSISRKHCKFIRGDTGLELKDLASSNGTFVNNQRVQETILKAGDRVVVGPVVFVCQIDGDPADPKPVKTKLTRKPGAAPAAQQAAPTPAAAPQAAPPPVQPAAPPQPAAEVESADSPSESQLGMQPGEELDPIAALEALAGAVGSDDATVDVEPSEDDEDEQQKWPPPQQ